MPHRYSCFCFDIRSDIALPEIPEAPTLSDASDERVIHIRCGALPAALPHAHHTTEWLQVGDGEVLLHVENIARYLIRDGREIVIDPAPGSSERNVRLFLLGSALAILVHQRGLLPLHANAIVARGRACAFGGAAGVGKSTLAAWFQRAGYDVLCDDVCVVSFDEMGRPLAWPGLPRLKLWGDAAASFGYDSTTLEPAVDRLDKYHLSFAQPAGSGPFPLERLYVLEAKSADPAGPITRVRGAAAFDAVMSHTYRSQYLAPMGLKRRHLELADTVVKRVEIYRAPRRWGYDVLAQEAAKLERHFLEP